VSGTVSRKTGTTSAAAPHAADSHEMIRVLGARVNNLKDVSVEIPKRRLTVFTGVSGSGKSSLVFDTIAAESQRLINETYSAFVQGFMPALARPEVDLLEGLTTAIIVDQERMGANPRSTVGTATDAHAMLRILFSRLGKPHVGPPTAFSFNVPTRRAGGVMSTEKGGRVEKKVVRDAVYLGGMCPRCEGTGAVSRPRCRAASPIRRPSSTVKAKSHTSVRVSTPAACAVVRSNRPDSSLASAAAASGRGPAAQAWRCQAV
jgi:energy-coupling factor transporter ATP-binding protein EcfA2